MKTLELKPYQISYSEFRRRAASQADCADLISESTIITEQGKPKIIYLELSADFSELVDSIHRIKFRKDSRTSGLSTNSRAFGYLPRVTIRRDFCTAASLSTESPVENSQIFQAGVLAEKYYKEFMPDVYRKHKEIADSRFLPEYRINQTVFTSGVVNKNNRLLYHFDSGNLPGSASAMFVFKDKIKGGFLAVPSYSICFELKNASLLIFEGQSILHGVTEITRLSPSAYRYSIVYYSLQNIWNCLPLGQELARIRKIKSGRESARLVKT